MADKDVTTNEIMEVLSSMKERMVTKDELVEVMKNNEATTNEIMEVLSFMKDHMVTKEELKQEISSLREEMHYELALRPTKEEMKLAINESVTAAKDEILNAVDGLVTSHKTFEVEQLAMQNRMDRNQDRLLVVERKVGIVA